MYKKRVFSLCKKCAIFLALGLAYYLYVRFTGYGIPCVFQVITHKYCPGCGASRMMVSLIHGDILAAAQYNLLLLVLLPFGLVYGTIKSIQYIRYGEFRTSKFDSIMWIILFALAIIFSVMRNLPQFSFLAPLPYGV